MLDQSSIFLDGFQILITLDTFSMMFWPLEIVPSRGQHYGTAGYVATCTSSY